MKSVGHAGHGSDKQLAQFNLLKVRLFRPGSETSGLSATLDSFLIEDISPLIQRSGEMMRFIYMEQPCPSLRQAHPWWSLDVVEGRVQRLYGLSNFHALRWDMNIKNRNFVHESRRVS